MPSISIEATKREETGKRARSLLHRNIIPAVVYGHDRTSTAIAVPYATFERAYAQAGESSLVDLKINEDQPVKVLIQSIQSDPLTGKFRHVDFHQVKMTEKLNADVALKFIGESKAVKELGGVLIKALDHIPVECLAKDLIHEIDVDISVLRTFDDVIRVRDLRVPTTVSVKHDTDDVVATVQPPRSEEEIKELEAKPEAEIGEVEVAEKGKKKDEDAEGETAAPADEKGKVQEEKK